MPSATVSPARAPVLGYAWLALCCALAIHVTDEAATDFLGVWNPTMQVLRAHLPWAPLPVFPFGLWLGGLVALVVALAALTPAFFHGGGRLRPLAWFLAVVMIGNGLGHITATIFGHTVSSVRFPRPAPGFYSSPLLLASAIWLIVQLRASRDLTPEDS